MGKERYIAERMESVDDMRCLHPKYKGCKCHPECRWFDPKARMKRMSEIYREEYGEMFKESDLGMGSARFVIAQDMAIIRFEGEIVASGTCFNASINAKKEE